MENHFDRQLQAAREQLAYRRDTGDCLDVPRPIDHVAYFARKPQASKAAAALEEAGYRTELTRWRVFGASLEATRPSTLDETTVKAFMHEVRDIVVAHNGDYDGWGGEMTLDSTDGVSPDES